MFRTLASTLTDSKRILTGWLTCAALRLYGVALGLGLATALHAQVVFNGGPKQPQLTPARPFTWESGVEDRGAVRIPVGGGGWKMLADPGFQVRLVPSFSSDLTVEVILWPSVSGVAGKAERFLVQFPLAALGGGPRPTVVAFHPYGVSEKSPFQATALPQLCQQKGWMLIAPYGLLDTNYASVESQQALVSALQLVRAFLPIDMQRLWAVGFSMGGLNALSFGLRHQDVDGFRFAGIVDHSGPIDVVRQYELGNSLLQSILADADHFGGTPAQQPFAYERVSPAPLLGGAVDPLRAAVANLRHLPIYLHCNLQDPETELVDETLALHAYLQAEGVNVRLSKTESGALHAWSTLDIGAAFAFLELYPLTAAPTSLNLHADRVGAWLATEVTALPAQQVARYRLDRLIGSNAAELYGTRALDALALDLPALGLSVTQPLYLGTQTADGTADQLLLRGYNQPPTAVTLFGVLPVAWTWDESTATVAVVPSPLGSYAQLVVQP
jgi:predicted esterase